MIDLKKVLNYISKQKKDIINISKLCKKNPDHITTRKYSDMKSYYTEKINKNPVLYKVYVKQGVLLNYGLTIINPGKIGNEYYFTKGHKHKNDSEELYYPIKGKGKLILQNNKRTIIKDLNKPIIVPKGYAHRTINTGRSKLEVMTVYSPKAGHDYSIKIKK